MRTCPQCQQECEQNHTFCPSCGFPIGKVAKKTDDPLVGRTLPGGYVILELVGIGGMGRVYRAEQTTLGRTVAVKIIHPHLVGEESAAARFITEARAASRLNHPNSVGVIDFGKTDDGQLYLVMEFLRGKDLARVQYEDGPLSFRRIVDVLRQTLAALSEAHHLGIIHRDLKPENIILEPNRSGGDFVKVVDFGLAKMLAEAPAQGITSPGIVCGTPEYMSPEQGRGDPLDARSDLYAVGVILYQLLVGRLPFEAESPTQVVLLHIAEAPLDPRMAAPERNIPEGLADVCLRVLSKDPADRFEDADTLAAALVEAVPADALSARALKVSGVRCASCGEQNVAGQKFCGECGAPMSMAPPSTRNVAPAATLAPAELGPSASRAPLVVRGTRGLASDTIGRPSPPVGRRPAQLPLPLVAREAELAWLEGLLLRGDHGMLDARILGESGFGKTRLIQELLTRATARGHAVVEVGPDPGWAEVGLYTVRRAIVALAALPEDGGSERDHRAASPEARRGLAEVFEHDGRGAASAEVLRYAIAEALRWAIVRSSERASARGRRVVLAVDDFHAIDSASRTAFADAASEPPLVPCLLLIACPPGHDPGWPAGAEATRTLEGLAPATAATLLQGAARPSVPHGDKGMAPLYVEQLVHFTREQGGRAPSRLADLIALRVERLPPDARRVLQAVSTYGDDASPAIVTKLVPEGTDLAAAFASLVESGMLARSALDTYAAAHPLLRDIVLSAMPAGVRRELHATCAEIGLDHRMPLEARALHEYFAQNTFQALILLEQVATQATARGDLQGAVGALRRCLDLARRELFRGELDDPMQAVVIFARKLGEALTAAGSYTDADGVLREALEMAGPAGLDRARVLGALARVSAVRDRGDEADRYLREAFELAFASGARDVLGSLEDIKRAIAS